MKNQLHNKHPTASRVIFTSVIITALLLLSVVPCFAYGLTDGDATTAVQTPIVPYFKSRAFYAYNVAEGIGDFRTWGDDSLTGEQFVEFDRTQTITTATHTYTDLTSQYSTLTRMSYDMDTSYGGGEIDNVDLILSDAYIGTSQQILSERDVFGELVFNSYYSEFFPDSIRIDYMVYDVVNDVESDNITSIGTIKRTGQAVIEKRILDIDDLDRTVIGYPIYDALYEIQQSVSDNTITTYVDYLYIPLSSLNGAEGCSYYCYGYVADDSAADIDTPLQSLNPIAKLRGTPNITDSDISAIGLWLGTAVDGFFNFEIGGVNLGYIFVAIFALLILIAVLKFFAGG